MHTRTCSRRPVGPGAALIRMPKGRKVRDEGLSSWGASPTPRLWPPAPTGRMRLGVRRPGSRGTVGRGSQPGPGVARLRGSDASHAWAAVYLPDLPPAQRWCDLDPTNNRVGWHSPGEDYVTLATGRDFGDVSPMRGVIYGGASHTLSVGVTVEPLPERPAAWPVGLNPASP